MFMFSGLHVMSTKVGDLLCPLSVSKVLTIRAIRKYKCTTLHNANTCERCRVNNLICERREITESVATAVL